MAHIDEQDMLSLRKDFEQAGQGHVFRWWDEFSSDEREQLVADARQVRAATGPGLAMLGRLKAEHLDGEGSSKACKLEAVEGIPLPATPEEEAFGIRARQVGEALLRDGKVAAFTVAGGQSTRLGLDCPKGAFPIGPVSERTLFQIFAEGILAASRRYGATIPWYVMTSVTNDGDTRAFFEEHEHFGLDPGDVFFFAQGMLPAVSPEGKILMRERHAIFLCPDGHGGSLYALGASGALEDMKKRGISHISYFQVDNPLVKPVDPVFLGYHEEAGAEMSVKVVDKNGPFEKTGVVGKVDGRYGVIEYSDLSEEDAKRTLPDGRLHYRLGNIAVHILNVSFVDRMAGAGGDDLPFHCAHKKVPCIDDEGRTTAPTSPNGVKFERFVFDAMGYAQSVAVMSVEREEEFAPVKNKEGDDSPETSKRLLIERDARWLEAAGVTVPRDAGGAVSAKIEISPLFALDFVDLAAKVGPELLVGASLVLVPNPSDK